MKKSILKLCCAVLTLFVFVSAVSGTAVTAQTSVKDTPATALDAKTEAAPDAQKVLEARFLNMLNHNYVYNDDFSDVEALVNDSMPALINGEAPDDFISEAAVRNYVFDFYGVNITDFSSINADFPKKEGYVYIIPVGFTRYDHSAVSLTENEDGTYTFVSNVIIRSHDAQSQTNVCTSLFAPNPDSAFGYNIIHSYISFSDMA